MRCGMRGVRSAPRRAARNERPQQVFEIRHTCTPGCYHPWKSRLWSMSGHQWMVTFPDGQRHISNGLTTMSSDGAGFESFEEARAYTAFRIDALAVGPNEQSGSDLFSLRRRVFGA
jgi:hypothetical protein